MTQTSDLNLEPRSFPRPGTDYYGYTQDPDYQSKFLGSFKTLNKIIVPLYRIGLLPLLGVHRFARVYLITVKGRKTGIMRTIPLEYFVLDDELYGGVSGPSKSQWYKNALANPDEVWVQIGFRKFHAQLEFLDDEGTIEALKQYAVVFPNMAKFWGWDPKRDNVETADFSPMLSVYKLFRIHER